MARSLSTAMTRAINMRETSELFLVCLTIAHPAIQPPIRVVNDTVDLKRNVHRDPNDPQSPITFETFVGFPFEITLPSDGQGPPKSTLRIQNVDRRIGEGVDLVTDPPTLLIEVVRKAAPDVVEVSWPNFLLRNASGDVMEVQGELGLDDYSVEPWPYIRATKSRTPAAWRIRA